MRRFLVTIIAIALAGCASQPQQPPAAASRAVTSTTGFDVANVDRSAKACTDFYQFAVGGWLKSHPIPAGYPSWGNFSVLALSNQEKMRAILDDATRTNAPAGSIQQKAGDFYESCMDEKAIERAGIAPITPDLRRVSALSSVSDLPQMLAHFHSYGIPVVFNAGSTPNYQNADQSILAIQQAGLGLPDRDYYTKEDAKSKEIRIRYTQHIARMLQFLGDDPVSAGQQARNIMDFETKLALASMTNVELRDPVATHHKMTREELQALAPSFSWPEYFAAMGQPAVTSIDVQQPNFISSVDPLIKTTPVDVWRSYLRWHLVDAEASRLPRQFEEADFDFYQRYLEGTKEMKPRWKRCVSATDAALGEAVGQLWTQRYFPEAAKAQTLEMVRNLMRALQEDITTLAWMGPGTRQQALSKLQAFGLKIGYPEKWRDYSPLTISRQPYVTNSIAASQFEAHRDWTKVDQPVDKTEWLMSPPTVNAYNNPQFNEIVFPAGILQPPFFDPNADAAYNYGGMGAVIGHEIIHGFDDQGRQFDLRGNLADWWSAEDKQRFLERAKCVSDQFSSYAVGPDKMTGDLVLGESIADLGGLQIAYAAYQKSQEGKPRQIIDGFTPEQRFFLGWAQVWAENATAEWERLMITTDPHPISRFRVNGPLSNMPEFASAFGCRTADAMVRSDDKRCNVWGTTSGSTPSSSPSSH